MNIFKASILKRRSNQSYIKWIIIQLHLWLGLIAGAAICFISITGAIYLFRNEVIELSYYNLINRDTDSTSQESISQEDVDITTILANVTSHIEDDTYSISQIAIPYSSSKNIKVVASSGRSNRQTYFVDRGSKAVLGKTTNKESQFFSTVMRLHRWFGMDNSNVGRQIVAILTILFIILLLSGVVMWWPNSRRGLKQKMSLTFGKRFKLFNRVIHINYGFYVTVPLIILSITGICFTYSTVRNTTVNIFKRDIDTEEAIKHLDSKLIGEELNQLYTEMLKDSLYKKPEIHEIDFNSMVSETNTKLNYSGDITISLPNRRSPSITANKRNSHNLLGAELSDQILFDESADYIATLRFKDKKLYQKVSSLIKPIHMGDILGLKGKILYLIISLIGAYLPISGYILWIKRVRKRIRKG